MIRILKTAKFPLEVCGGSPEKRLELAKKLNNELFNRLSEKYSTKELPLDIFEKTVIESTPANINVNVDRLKNAYLNGGLTDLSFNPKINAIEGFNIYLPLNKPENTVRLYSTDTSIHEAFHYFSHLANPKHSAREAKMYELGLDALTEEFYKKNLYTRKEFNSDELKKSLDNFLKDFSKREQIEFLQNSRYRMTEEYHAYDEGFKYLDKIQDEHPDLISEKIYGREKEEYNFPEKIKIITDKLREVITAYRKS